MEISNIITLFGGKGLNDKDYKNKIQSLKILRVDAVYRDLQIDYQISNDSIDLANDLLKILKPYK